MDPEHQGVIGGGALVVCPLSPMDCKCRPQWIWLALAHSTDARLDWDLGSFEVRLKPWALGHVPFLSSLVAHIFILGKIAAIREGNSHEGVCLICNNVHVGGT